MAATRTKIICTIGPASNTFEKMVELIQAGMSVARINFSHGTHLEHFEAIQNLKRARQELKKPLAIMLDTKGPEIRLGKIKDGKIVLQQGQKWLLHKEEVIGDEEKVSINPGSVLEGISIGTEMLFDDGYINSHVVDIVPEGLIVEIKNGGVIRSNKGVNVPNASLNLPNLTDKDVEDLIFGCQNDIDIVAASFVCSAEHVLTIKKLLISHKKPEILIIAKIESHEGIQNFDSIVQVADGIMIARGDLGVEMPQSQVPRLQKMMIRKSYLAGKISVTATHMLESMIYNPRPTRAETSDVANAIYDGTSAVMLSGETAVGGYPVETVNMMRSIIEEAETDFHYSALFDQHASLVYQDVPSAVTLATVKTAYSLDAQAIFAFTKSGLTAQLLSRLRPKMPIIALTPNEKSYNQLAINWGVIPYYSLHSQTISEAFLKLSILALTSNLIRHGDLVVVTAGSPFGISGTTNMMMVESIGDVLVRGHGGYGSCVHGNVALALYPDARKPYTVKDQLLVITKCNESYLPLLKEVAGIILQNPINDIESEKYAMEMAKILGKSLLLRADEASRILKEGQLVTLDPGKALVYKGVVL
jgi:pyruvate kinase